MKVLAAVVLLVLVAVLVLRPRPDVAGEEARALIQDGALLVDVRSPEEFSAGHLEGAINLPVGELAGRLDELRETADDGARVVVVYCQSGMRSARAKRTLEEAGFASVRDLGSRFNW